METRPLAVVTGASSGIGYQFARCCAEKGYDLVICADEPEIEQAAAALRQLGAAVEALQADLATQEGVEALYRAARGQGGGQGDGQGRAIDVLLANAGRGLGGAFLEQDFAEVRRVVETNVTGTLLLLQKVGRDMQARRRGRILVTGSIAGYMPGTYLAVYNASKAFIDSFAVALRHELKDSGVTVTCLTPGPTDTDFFERAEMLDTKVAQDDKDDPARVARLGFEAMEAGRDDLVTGWKNKALVAASRVLPPDRVAELHRSLAEPGSGRRA